MGSSFAAKGVVAAGLALLPSMLALLIMGGAVQAPALAAVAGQTAVAATDAPQTTGNLSSGSGPTPSGGEPALPSPVSASAVEPAMPASSAPAPVAAASVPKSASEPVFTWSGYFEAIGIMLLLLGGLWFLLWVIRRYGKFNFLPSGQGLPRDALRMEAQLPLGPKKGLVVVRFLNERLLLGVTDHQINVLTERLIVEPADDAPTASPPVTADAGSSFAELLRGKGLTPDEPGPKA